MINSSKNKVICSLLLMLGMFSIHAQDSTKKVFTEQDFIAFVLKNHPVARQADLITQTGQMALRQARGGFDPYLKFSEYSKQLKGKEYFDYTSAGLVIPTWYGIEFKTGIDVNDNTAYYFNPERSTSSNGTGVFGVSAPLLQGMFIDQRRAVLKQAKIFRESSEQQRISMFNDLLYDAVKTYWEWADSYNDLLIFKNSLLISNNRFKAVKRSFKFGDKPAIDTVEALIQVQSIDYMLNQTMVAYNNASLSMSNYLWNEFEEPLELDSSLIPELMSNLVISTSSTRNELLQVDSLITNHPLVRMYQFKIDGLKIDKRLKAEKLKPKLNVDYALLTDGYTTNFSSQNYKLGVSFSFPLFLRDERGGLGLAKIKIRDAGYQLDIKRLEVKNKILAYQYELNNLVTQVGIYESAVSNYQTMLNAEERKMFIGESTVFLVNSREQKLFEAQRKLIELKAKYFKTKAALSWASGSLFFENSK